MSAAKPTTATMHALQIAYDVFNARLFDGKLPDCLITYQRKRGARGYFWPTRFENVCAEKAPELAEKVARLDEIALNPDHFEGARHHGSRGPEEDVLSTLLHEMVHLWQQHLATKKPKGGYHDKTWAGKMKEVGLYPSVTGQPGGKETGRSCTHYIVPNGPFVKVYEGMLLGGVPLFGDLGRADTDAATRKKKAASKTKYTCTECQANAWAKPETALICGDCEAAMVSEGEED